MTDWATISNLAEIGQAIILIKVMKVQLKYNVMYQLKNKLEQL